MHYSYYEKRCDQGNVLRYYSVRIDEDLFGCYIVVRQWGRVNQKSSPISKCCDTLESALQELTLIAQSRRKHGFELVMSTQATDCIHQA